MMYYSVMIKYFSYLQSQIRRIRKRAEESSFETRESSFEKPGFFNIHHSKGFPENNLFLKERTITIRTYRNSHNFLFRSVASIYARTPVRTAGIWEKYIFYCLKAFLSFNWLTDKFFALYWRLYIKFSFILSLLNTGH